MGYDQSLILSEPYVEFYGLLTSVKGIFAAGDVRSGATMQIATATGEGATAALKIRQYLENLTR